MTDTPTPQAWWWDHAGRPEITTGPRANRRPATWTTGRCAICGHHGDIHPQREIVSDGFNDWYRCRHRHPNCGFCPACAWTLRHRPFRTHPHTAGTTGTLFEALSRPVTREVAVAVPISRQIHVAPFVEWGHVHTDRRALTWGPTEVERLHLVAHLRTLGFSEPALAEAAPRWLVMRRLDPDQRRDVLDAWARLEPWRVDPEPMAVAVRATRTPKEHTT